MNFIRGLCLILVLPLTVGTTAPLQLSEFIIYFPARLANITAEADAVLSEAIRACGVGARYSIRAQADISDCRHDPVIAVGGCEVLYAEDPYNADLLRDYQKVSELRARAVAQNLTGKGALPRSIELRAVGLVYPKIRLDEQIVDPANRRAAVTCNK